MTRRIRPIASINIVETSHVRNVELGNSNSLKAIYLYDEENLNLMKYFGVYTYTSQKGKTKIFQMAYSMVLLTYEFYAVAAHASNLRYEQHFDTVLFYKLLVCIFRLYLAVVLLIPSLTLGNIKRFRKNWRRLKYRKGEEFHSNIKKELKMISSQLWFPLFGLWL